MDPITSEKNKLGVVGVGYAEMEHFTITEPSGCLPKGWLSPYCNGNRGKTAESLEQRVSTEEKSALVPTRYFLSLLGKLPLRQIGIKLF